MGLDVVEFVLDVENTFGLAIPNEDAERLATPGDVVDYLESRLAPGSGACLEQRAFHALRRAGMQVLGRPRSDFRPDVEWDALLPTRGRRRAWELMQHATGVAAWPRIGFLGTLPPDAATVGAMARFLATHAASTLQPPGTGWSRDQIEATIRQLMRAHFFLDEFNWTDRFVEDLDLS